MFSYWVSRWRLSRCFERQGDGYLYRRRPTSEAIRVTAEERSRMFRRFRSAYWKTHGLLFVAVLACLIAIVGIAVLIDMRDNVFRPIVYCLVALMMLAVFLADRHIFNAVASEVDNREAIEPARKRSQVRDDRIGKIRWWRLAAGGLFLGSLAWLFFPGPGASPWFWTGWSGYFGLIFVLWARNVWRKWQLQQLG